MPLLCTDTPKLDDVDALDKPAQVNMAFKVIELLGHILRSHYASLEGDKKVALCEAAYSLSLRTLTEFLNDVSYAGEFLIEEITEYLQENTKKDEAAVGKLAREIAFELCARIAHAIVKRTADSVGSEMLRKTYSRLEKEQKTAARGLLDIAIKFEHFRDLPFKEIGDVQKLIKSKMLPKHVLRLLAVEHLHKFEREKADKDRLCSAVDVSQETRKNIILSRKSMSR